MHPHTHTRTHTTKPLPFVLQSMKEEERRGLTPLQLRKKAAEFALKTVDAQREQFQRWAGHCGWGRGSCLHTCYAWD